MSTAPLKGLRVADFTQGVAGPYSAMLLGDLGAEVIKVEPLRGDWCRAVGRRIEHGMSPSFISLNRNKKSLCLDLKSAEGRKAALRLAQSSQMLVESFRPGVMQRFGLEYQALAVDNPALIYGSITGFGQEGPYADRPATDAILQALSGIMSINGEQDGDPLRFGMFIVDMVTGLTANQALLAALLSKATSGAGQHVKVSLLDSIVAFQASPITEFLMYGHQQERQGNVNAFVQPSGVFKTRDSHLVLAVLDHQWENFCQAMNWPELIHDPRYDSNPKRMANRNELLARIAPEFSARSTQECLELLQPHDVICGPIQDYRDLSEDPQVVANNLLGSQNHPVMGKLPVVRHAAQFGAFEPELAPAPMLGEHSLQILRDTLDYSEAEAESLIARGTVKTGEE